MSVTPFVILSRAHGARVEGRSLVQLSISIPVTDLPGEVTAFGAGLAERVVRFRRHIEVGVETAIDEGDEQRASVAVVADLADAVDGILRRPGFGETGKPLSQPAGSLHP